MTYDLPRSLVDGWARTARPASSLAVASSSFFVLTEEEILNLRFTSRKVAHFFIRRLRGDGIGIPYGNTAFRMKREVVSRVNKVI